MGYEVQPCEPFVHICILPHALLENLEKKRVEFF